MFRSTQLSQLFPISTNKGPLFNGFTCFTAEDDGDEGDDLETENLDKVESESALQYLKYMKSASLADVGDEPLFTDQQCRMLMLAVSFSRSLCHNYVVLLGSMLLLG